MYIPKDASRPNQVARPAPEERTPSDEPEPAEGASSTLVVPREVENAPPETIDVAVAAESMSEVALEALDVPAARPRPKPTIYRADADKVQTVHLLVIALVLGALFTAGPVAWHPNLFAAPDWVRLVLLISLVQLAYVAWVASLPDWASVWVAMLVNALVATFYGAALAIFLYTPVESPLPLGLGDVSRRTAAGWCLCVVLITTLLCFACGRVCAVWRRADAWKRRRQAGGTP
jgi:hypothetical protein